MYGRDYNGDCFNSNWKLIISNYIVDGFWILPKIFELLPYDFLIKQKSEFDEISKKVSIFKNEVQLKF